MSQMSRHQKIKQSLTQGYNISKISIPSYHIADDVVVYEVDVSNKKLRWNLWLRYEFFYVLHQMMQELIAELSTPENQIQLPPFPEKRLKYFVDHFDPHFIENRRMLLDNYLNRILQNRTLRHSEIFIQFLTPPENEELETSVPNNTIKQNKNNSSKNIDEKSPDINNDNNISNGKYDHANPKKSDKLMNDDDESKVISQSLSNNSNSNSNSNNNSQNDSDRPQTPQDSAALDIEKRRQKELESEMIGVDDNDEVTGICISQGQVLKQDHTIYQIHVFNTNKRKSFSEWTVLKRYGEFNTFDEILREAITNDHPDQMDLIPPCPPKYVKLFTDHLEETFIEKRRLLLQCYLQRLIKYPLFRRHDLTLKFLGVDD